MSENKQRKATDVLLELEEKLDLVITYLRTQDMTIKLLSNAVNELKAELNKLSPNAPRPTIEAVNLVNNNQVSPPSNSMMITSASNLPIEQAPKGFPRTSRPETYAGDDSYLNSPKMPLQMPKLPKAEIVVPDVATKQNVSQPPQKQKPPQTQKGSVINVEQRIVNRESKSVFLADVEIFDIDSGEKVHKTRTNGTGKWMAALPVGKYRVIIRKREPVMKTNVEVSQEIVVDGNESPLRLQMMIFK